MPQPPRFEARLQDELAAAATRAADRADPAGPQDFKSVNDRHAAGNALLRWTVFVIAGSCAPPTWSAPRRRRVRRHAAGIGEQDRRVGRAPLALPTRAAPSPPHPSRRSTSAARDNAADDEADHERPAAGRQPARRLDRGGVARRARALRRPGLRAARRRDRAAPGVGRLRARAARAPEPRRGRRRGDRLADRHPAPRLRDAGLRDPRRASRRCTGTPGRASTTRSPPTRCSARCATRA